MRRPVLVVVLLLGLAAAMMPLEDRIRAERVALKYGGTPVTLAMRDRVGQGMAIGLLAGFRGVVADFLWIGNHGYFERKEWIRMYRNMELCTTLQPQAVTFWDTGAWHMGWNIAHAVSIDPANRTQAEGLKRQREWQNKAREFLADGLANIPHRWELHHGMGMLYWLKFNDHCQARDFFRQATAFPDAPSYCLRMYARRVEDCDGPQAAYDLWKQYWREGNPIPSRDGIDLKSVMRRELRRLEERLNIPAQQRIRA